MWYTNNSNELIMIIIIKTMTSEIVNNDDGELYYSDIH